MHLVNWATLCKPIKNRGTGSKQTHAINMSLLAKAGWRLLKEPDSVWSRLLKAKYGGGSTLRSIFQEKQNSSNAWRGIVWSPQILHRGIKWVDWKRISFPFWEDVWLEDKPLTMVALKPVSDNTRKARVADYWTEDSGWL